MWSSVNAYPVIFMCMLSWINKLYIYNLHIQIFWILTAWMWGKWIFYVKIMHVEVIWPPSVSYCNVGVRVCVSVCLSISHYYFLKCGLIVTKLYMEVAGYDMCIVRIYRKSRGHQNCKEHIIVDNSLTKQHRNAKILLTNANNNCIWRIR